MGENCASRRVAVCYGGGGEGGVDGCSRGFFLRGLVWG